MEIDHVTYIFGSFTRRKPSATNKRRSQPEPRSSSARRSYLTGSDSPQARDLGSVSAGSSPLHRASRASYCRARSGSLGSVAEGQLECGLCRRELVDPRLLACLHTFCRSCLQNLRHWDADIEEATWRKDEDGELEVVGFGSRGRSVSAASGYESDVRSRTCSEDSDGGTDRDLSATPAPAPGIYTRKTSGKSEMVLVCPKCASETLLPLGGVAALPVNYIAQRRLVAAHGPRNGALGAFTGVFDQPLGALGDGSAVLCDLCADDTPAASRCVTCGVRVCAGCRSAHARAPASQRHTLAPLSPAPAQLTAPRHPCSDHHQPLSLYCSSCAQVICRECALVGHAGHALGGLARAAEARARLLRHATQRAADLPLLARSLHASLVAQARDAEEKGAALEAQIVAWREGWARAVHEHAQGVCRRARAARRGAARTAADTARALHDATELAHHAQIFAEQVLEEASPEELVSLAPMVARRLEQCCDLEPLCHVELQLPRFEPLAPAQEQGSPYPLVGRLLTAAPDSLHTTIHLEDLKEVRVGRRREVRVSVRDARGGPCRHGGDAVRAWLRLGAPGGGGAGAAPYALPVSDLLDGTYLLTLAPAQPGTHVLAVLLNDTPIKGSPFTVEVLGARAHTGKFHCCAFCSSGGRRDAACGCGATIAPGYKGCGHGHAGHPGGRHWSCCGQTDPGAPCSPAPAPALTTARPNTYHVSL